MAQIGNRPLSTGATTKASRYSFALSDVTLLPGIWKTRQDLNTRYILELDPDRLLHSFRVQAGLPSSAEPYGGWEAPDCGLRGHFVGHYLSACALGYAATGNPQLRDRALFLITHLHECQQAIGTGYLGAYPDTEFDRIEQGDLTAWAPYYTRHKMLAGLVDTAQHIETEPALQMATWLAHDTCTRIEKLKPQQLDAMVHTDRIPNPHNEFGAISVPLQQLVDLTGEARFDRVARCFEPDWFTDALVNNHDILTGLHANTHIAIALGLATRYQRTADPRLLTALTNFWEQTAIARSYVNGGNSGPHPLSIEKSIGAEHWPHANQLADTLTPKINESCVTHNMLRLTDALHRWTAAPRYADFSERARTNHVLAMQHPDAPGRYLYDHPLGPCTHKHFGDPHSDFWCCYGSCVENFTTLNAAIYDHDDDTLYINRLVPSRLHWHDRDVQIVTHTQFPDGCETRIFIEASTPAPFTITIRPPLGIDNLTVRLNQQPIKPTSQNLITITRRWNPGDQILLDFDTPLRIETMPDDHGMFALFSGPLLLALTAHQSPILPIDSPDVAINHLTPSPHDPLVYHAMLASGITGTFLPIHRITDESFSVYMRCTGQLND